MYPVVLKALQALIRQSDKSTFPDYMWLGEDGVVRTGQSTVIDPPDQAIQFIWSVPNDPLRQSADPYAYSKAPDATVLAQWALVKKEVGAFPSNSNIWQALTNARLSQESLDRLVADAAYKAEPFIKDAIPSYPTLVADVALAILRRALRNPDPSGFAAANAHFVNAINLKDYSGDGGTDTVEAELLRNGQAAIAQTLSPTTLIFPNAPPAYDFPSDYVLEQPVATFRNPKNASPSLWDSAVDAYPLYDQATFQSEHEQTEPNEVSFQNNPDNSPTLPRAQSTTVLDPGGFDPFQTQATQQALRAAAQEAAAAARAVPLELSSANSKLGDAVDTLSDVRDDANKLTASTTDQIQTGLAVGGVLFLMKILWDRYGSSSRKTG